MLPTYFSPDSRYWLTRVELGLPIKLSGHCEYLYQLSVSQPVISLTERLMRCKGICDLTPLSYNTSNLDGIKAHVILDARGQLGLRPSVNIMKYSILTRYFFSISFIFFHFRPSCLSRQVLRLDFFIGALSVIFRQLFSSWSLFVTNIL
jgi:hypothetical protein